MADNSDWPIIRILEREEVSENQVKQLFREINDRQWSAVIQVLIEAKIKAESQLRNDGIFGEPGRVAFCLGWLAYSDHVIAEFNRLRQESERAEAELHPGPEFDFS